MIHEEFITEMMKIGMTEYEAKVYAVLFQMKFATVREVYDICAVPRNKVYESLRSLEEKGFAAIIGSNPLRYARTDISETFRNLKQDAFHKYSAAEKYLLSQERPDPVFESPHAYELQSDWAIQNHLKTILSQCKSELIINTADTEYLLHVIPKKTLKMLAKKVNLYVIVKDADASAEIPVPCSIFDEVRIPKSLRNERPSLLMAANCKLTLFSDRTTMLTIDVVNGELLGTVYFMNKKFFIGLLAETMISCLKTLP